MIASHPEVDKLNQQQRNEVYRAALAMFQRAGMNSYRGGIRTRVDTPWSRGLNVYGFPQNTENIHQMRARARNLTRNNVLASSVLDRDCENVIGTGIRVRPATSSRRFNEQAKAYWKFLTSGTRLDIRGLLTWPEIQWHAYRAMQQDGDHLTVMVSRRDASGKGQPRLQLVDTGLLQRPPNRSILEASDGVEVNDVGAPVRFWIKSTDRRRVTSWTPIDRRDAIYLPNLENGSSQIRGIPAFNGMYVLFDQIMGVLDAVVIAWRIGASQAMIHQSDNPDDEYDAATEDVTGSDGKEQTVQDIEPGTIHYTDRPGKLTAFTPSQPQQQMPEAIRLFCRFVGLKFGLTVERVLLDFTKANYSVSRSTKLQEIQSAAPKQNNFIAKYIDRVYPWAISKAIKNGDITARPPADFFAYSAMPPHRPIQDPEKELPGYQKSVALSINSRRRIAEMHGFDFEEVARENAEDTELLRELGLPTGTETTDEAPRPDAARGDEGRDENDDNADALAEMAGE